MTRKKAIIVSAVLVILLMLLGLFLYTVYATQGEVYFVTKGQRRLIRITVLLLIIAVLVVAYNIYVNRTVLLRVAVGGSYYFALTNKGVLHCFQGASRTMYNRVLIMDVRSNWFFWKIFEHETVHLDEETFEWMIEAMEDARAKNLGSEVEERDRYAKIQVSYKGHVTWYYDMENYWRVLERIWELSPVKLPSNIFSGF